jgi:hypothetical protein
MRLFALLSFIIVVHPSFAEDAVGSWRQLSPGLEVYSGEYKQREPYNSTHVLAIRVDQRSYRLRIASLAGLPQQSGTISGQPRQSASTLRSLIDNHKIVAAMNGSYVTSYAFPRSLGFARSGGITVAPVSKAKLLSGLICVSAKGETRVTLIQELPTLECLDGLQSGPMLVEDPFKNGISPSEPATRVFDRSVVCIDENSKILLIRAEKTALYDLAEFIRRGSRDNGLGCQAAVNLSGDADSGAFWRDGKGVESIGALDASAATALVVTLR